MKMSKRLSLVALSSLLVLSGEADAITVPDSSTCPSGAGTCLQITNNTNSSTAIFGLASNGTSYGVYGEGGFVGVKGASFAASGIGLQGYGTMGVYALASSSAGYGLYTENLDGIAAYVNGILEVHGQPRAAQTTFTLFSDARLKKNIAPLEGSLARVLELRGVTYEWKQPSEHGNFTGPQMGFIAQDVEKVFPEWIGESNGFKTLTTRGLDALLVESVRTLKLQNDELSARVKALEGKQALSTASLTPLGLVALLLAGGILLYTRRRTSPDHPVR
jgi:hypothetical protein